MKKDLYENIQRAIAKGLNESLSSYIEENSPKFDISRFQSNMAMLIKAIRKYTDKGEYKNFRVCVKNMNNQTTYRLWTLTDTADPNSEQCAAEIVSSIYKNLGEQNDKVANAMKLGFIAIDLNQEDPHYAINWVESMLNPAGGNRIYLDKEQDCPVTVYKNQKYSIYITVEDFMNKPEVYINELA